MTKILLVGDSFAADWTIKNTTYSGWPNLLAEEFKVDNRAKAGVSEYRIWQQLSNCNIKNYTHLIISHTSPFRIPVEEHPLHGNDLLHNDCDFLYEDIKNHKSLLCVKEYFEKFFDTDYAKFVHQLIIEKQIAYVSDQCKVLHLHHMKQDLNFIPSRSVLDFSDVFVSHKGNVNHYSKQGNQIVFETIKKWI